MNHQNVLMFSDLKVFSMIEQIKQAFADGNSKQCPVSGAFASNKIGNIPLVPTRRNSDKKVLVEYVRVTDKQRQRNTLRGCLVAVKVGDKIQIGWSLCRRSGNIRDQFSKDVAYDLAYDRAISPGRKLRKYPHSIRDNLWGDRTGDNAVWGTGFIERIKRFFKIEDIKSVILDDMKEPSNKNKKVKLPSDAVAIAS